MNKGELAAMVAKECSLSKEKSNQVVGSVLESIIEALRKGEDVRLQGFGTFEVAIAPARTGRNPATGKPIKIAEAKRVKFRAGTTLKESLNGKRK